MYRSHVAGLLLALSALFSGSTAVSAQRIDSMFFVTKKQNKNEVHYAANTADCQWQKTDPVDVYWRMLAQGPDSPANRKKLDKGHELENFGYIATPGDDDRTLSIQLGAFKTVPELSNLIIRISLSGSGASCRSQQTIVVGGTTIALVSMHVDYSIRLLSGRINFVDFKGTDSAGKAVRKRVTNSR